MPDRSALETVADRYRWFAVNEAADSSALYRDWAEGVSADTAILERLAALPPIKTQPHLLFASARYCGAPLETYSVFGSWLRHHVDAVLEVVRSRSTQTNEAARCGVLLPVLGSIEGPVALIEVGASAGLCLIPDRYSYRYETEDGVTEIAGEPGAPVIRCRMIGSPPPTRHPDIVWRAGIDLNPLDATNADDARWLDLLVWPEHDDRRERLRAALALVARDPVRIDRGDLVDRLPELAAEAPDDATLVVMHTAVLNYLSADHRSRAVAAIRSTGALWISQEGVAVVDEVRERLPAHLGAPARYVLAVDTVPVALTAFHGGSYEALPRVDR